jgi:hypothetical protein
MLKNWYNASELPVSSELLHTDVKRCMLSIFHFENDVTVIKIILHSEIKQVSRQRRSP